MATQPTAHNRPSALPNTSPPRPQPHHLPAIPLKPLPRPRRRAPTTTTTTPPTEPATAAALLRQFTTPAPPQPPDRPRVNLPPPPTAASRRARAPIVAARSRRPSDPGDSDGSSGSAKTTASRRGRRERAEWVRVAAPEMPACEEVGAGEVEVSEWEEEVGRKGRGEVDEEDGEWVDVREEDAEAPVLFSKMRFVGSVLERLAKLP